MAGGGRGLLGGGGLRGHGELPLNADINVTSLVDVAFVLLIIFMITAPIMQGGVDVRLPRAEAKPLEPKSRSEEHTSELQSPCNLVCRLLLEKKKKKNHADYES